MAKAVPTSAGAGRSPIEAPTEPLPSAETARTPLWVKAGAVALLVAGCAFGMLEVHGSTDTWIGLAGGRAVMDGLANGQFPVKDTFNFIKPDVVWYNQNWLSHVYLWLNYKFFGPAAVIVGTWLLSVLTFLFVMLATYFRCRKWVPAIVAGALVGIGSRDWLSARPATMQFFCIALEWLCISALLGQGERRRWWPIVLLVPLFLAWPHAHGSFVFGYGLIAMFVGAGLFVWLLGFWGRKNRMGPGWQRLVPVFSRNQLIGLVAVVFMTGILGGALSPYGFENYTHQSKIVQSERMREVGEWHSPMRWLRGDSNANAFPPVKRFFAMLGIAAIALGVGAAGQIARAIQVPEPAPGTRGPGKPRGVAAQPAPSPWLHILLVDVGATVLALAMAMWARRFAPIFLILGAPAITVAALSIGPLLSAYVRRWVVDGLGYAMWAGAAITIYYTGLYAHNELVRPFEQNPMPADLLCRVTRHDTAPRQVLEFMSRNDLRANVFAEWKLNGPVMFEAPNSKVFIDGRAQQVYTEEHYLKYLALMNSSIDPRLVVKTLEKDGTNTVLTPFWPATRHIAMALSVDPNWLCVLQTWDGLLFVRRDSDVLRDLRAREQAGDLWWPDTPPAWAYRGQMRASLEPPDRSGAVDLWMKALAADATLTAQFATALTSQALAAGRQSELPEFFEAQKKRIAAEPSLPPDRRNSAIGLIQQCERLLMQSAGTPPTNLPATPQP